MDPGKWEGDSIDLARRNKTMRSQTKDSGSLVSWLLRLRSYRDRNHLELYQGPRILAKAMVSKHLVDGKGISLLPAMNERWIYNILPSYLAPWWMDTWSWSVMTMVNWDKAKVTESTQTFHPSHMVIFPLMYSTTLNIWFLCFIFPSLRLSNSQQSYQTSAHPLTKP